MVTATATDVRREDEAAGRWFDEQRVNVGTTERLISLASGVAIAWYGLSRRSLGGYALAAIGGALAYRGATGYCSVYQTLGVYARFRPTS